MCCVLVYTGSKYTARTGTVYASMVTAQYIYFCESSSPAVWDWLRGPCGLARLSSLLELGRFKELHDRVQSAEESLRTATVLANRCDCSRV